MTDVGTVMWMVGCLVIAGAVGFALGGLVAAAASVGCVLVVLGVFADLAGGPRSERDERDRAGIT